MAEWCWESALHWSCFSARVLILYIPLAILGVSEGAIGGALAPAEPPAYVEETAFMEENERTFGDTLANYPIQENFQSSFLKEAVPEHRILLVVVPEERPQTSEGMVGQGVDTFLNSAYKGFG